LIALPFFFKRTKTEISYLQFPNLEIFIYIHPQEKQRGEIMKKKGFVSVHAGAFFIVGLILGLALMYYLILKGIIPVSVAAPK